MDRSKLKAIVDVHIPGIARFLGITDSWHVFWNYQRQEGDVAARCKLEIDYRQAVISIDMDHLPDEDEVIDILFHEIAHIVLWPFDLYRNIVGQMIPNITDGQPNGMVETTAWKHACEGGVLALERIWRDRLRDLYLDEFTRPPGKGDRS